MIAAALAWLRARTWVRWLAIALGAIAAGVAAYLAGRRDERTAQGESNREALGETVLATDVLDAGIAARAEETRARTEAIDADTAADLAAVPTTDDAALNEARRMATEVAAEERSGR